MPITSFGIQTTDVIQIFPILYVITSTSFTLILWHAYSIDRVKALKVIVRIFFPSTHNDEPVNEDRAIIVSPQGARFHQHSGYETGDLTPWQLDLW